MHASTYKTDSVIWGAYFVCYSFPRLHKIPLVFREFCSFTEFPKYSRFSRFVATLQHNAMHPSIFSTWPDLQKTVLETKQWAPQYHMEWPLQNIRDQQYLQIRTRLNSNYRLISIAPDATTITFDFCLDNQYFFPESVQFGQVPKIAAAKMNIHILGYYWLATHHKKYTKYCN